MGWNEGFKIMEEQVVTAYDKGILTKELLNNIMESYKNTDIDTGGSRNLRANDGKNVAEIVCSIMEPEKYRKAAERSDCTDCALVDMEGGCRYDPETCWSDMSNLWDEITRREWNLW